MNRAALDKHLRSVLKEAQQAYRRGIAAQVLGETGAEHWRTFHEATSALLMASWLFGARQAIDKAKIPDEAVAGMLEDNTALTFDRLETGISLEGFGLDFLAPIANWFRTRVPISRTDWDVLIEAAQRSGGEVTDHERNTALPDMRVRNPVLDSLLRGITVNPQGGQISTAKRITDGTFFVTAMNPKQTRETQELIARVIEEKPGKSVVGKWIRKMNLGDFVTTTQMVTGTHLTTARLETVLRTNTNRAATEGLAETLREPKVQAFVPLVEYSATGDNRTRPTHQGLDGYIGTMEMFDRQGIAPPCGFNCFPSWQPVEGAVDMSFRASYCGALVHLNTRSGGTIAATANHPILTDRGWIPAYAVKVGDKMLRRSVKPVNAAEGLGYNQGNYLQPTALQIFNALAAKAVTRTTVSAKANGHMFDGDAISAHGEIDVVRTDRVLMFDVFNAQGANSLQERQLVGAGQPSLGFGASDQFVHASLSATNCSPSRPALPFDGSRILLDSAPFERFGLPLRAELDASLEKSAINRTTRYAERFGDLIGAFAGTVTLDDVVDVDVVSKWEGHVYDFRSSSGILLADGLIVSNCRCSLIPVPAARALERGWTDVDGNVNYAALKRHNGKRQQLIDTRQIPDPGFVNA